MPPTVEVMAIPATNRRDKPPVDVAYAASSAHLSRVIAKGDEQAFASFYEIWFDRVYAMARSVTRRDESFCLDVVQDCMMRVVRSMPSLATESAVSAWMCRTVFTTAIDRLRQDDRRARREREVSVPDRIDAPETLEEQAVWLRERLAELPDSERRLLLDRFERGGTLRAVGAAHGISGNAAHGRISRIIARLRRAASELFDD